MAKTRKKEKSITPTGRTKWRTGVSANPGGRPKGSKSLAARVREATRDGEDLVEFLLRVLNAEEDFEGASVRDRVDAAKILLDRGFGKALDRIAVADVSALPGAVQELSTDKLTKLAQALQGRLRERTVEASAVLLGDTNDDDGYEDGYEEDEDPEEDD